MQLHQDPIPPIPAPPSPLIQALGQAVNTDLQNRSIQKQNVSGLSAHNHSQLNTSGLKKGTVFVPPPPQNTSAINHTNPQNISVHDHPDSGVINRSVHNTSGIQRQNVSANRSVNRSVHNSSMPIQQPRSIVQPSVVVSPTVPSRMPLIAPRELSPALKAVFYLGIFLLIAEMLLMFGKYHFLGVLSALLVLSIFFVRFFDRVFSWTLIIVLVVSIVQDITWFVVRIRVTNFLLQKLPMINSNLINDGSSIHLMIVFGIVAVILAKICIIAALATFRNVESSQNYYINAFGMQLTACPQCEVGMHGLPTSVYHPVQH